MTVKKMVIDGEEAIIGDELYCLKNGIGRVTLINREFCELTFGRTTRARYSHTGLLGFAEVRTLYWHNPILFLPTKDRLATELTRELLTPLVRTAKITARRIRDGSL